MFVLNGDNNQHLSLISIMPFGEIVCGSPGSGKSTYCYGKHQLFAALRPPISIVNLDPANDALPYPCAIDISSLITFDDVMEHVLYFAFSASSYVRLLRV